MVLALLLFIVAGAIAWNTRALWLFDRMAPIPVPYLITAAEYVSKDISEDDKKRGLERIQKQTDMSIEKIDEILAEKEKEIMEV